MQQLWRMMDRKLSNYILLHVLPKEVLLSLARATESLIPMSEWWWLLATSVAMLGASIQVIYGGKRFLTISVESFAMGTPSLGTIWKKANCVSTTLDVWPSCPCQIGSRSHRFSKVSWGGWGAANIWIKNEYCIEKEWINIYKNDIETKYQLSE